MACDEGKGKGSHSRCSLDHLLVASRLRFASSSLERAFEEHVQVHFSKIDRYGMYVYVAVGLVMLARRVVASRSSADAGGGSSASAPVLLLCVILGNVWLLLGCKTRFRTPSTALLRGVLYPALFSLNYATWFKAQISDPRSFLGWLLSCTALAPIVLHTFFMPLLVKHNVPVQAVNLAWKMAFNLAGTCEGILRSPDNHKYFHIVWRAVTSWAWRLLSALFISEIKEVSEPDLHGACQQFVAFSHLVIGICAATYCLWLLERVARIEFLKRFQNPIHHAGCVELAEVASNEEVRWGAFSLWDPVYHAGIYLLFCAVAWTTLSEMYLPRESRCFLIDGLFRGGGCNPQLVVADAGTGESQAAANTAVGVGGGGGQQQP